MTKNKGALTLVTFRSEETIADEVFIKRNNLLSLEIIMLCKHVAPRIGDEITGSPGSPTACCTRRV